MRTPRPAGFIASFKGTSLEIFRVNKGPSSSSENGLLFHRSDPPYSISIHTTENAEWRLDASERAVPTGLSPTTLGKRLDYTPLPEELTLVHEHTDHYSLQPAIEMNLNQRITRFLRESGTLYTTEQWLAKYKLPAWSHRKAYGSRSVMDDNTFVG
ncbi:hypothetical protein NA56DRAFT_751370 [Hyaloscypha hepaticicola]|uniref:Tse2 ADP-ribosyltransferase toxin domain-containing protein n=1 Tax=Hyaloscypha hepaticicola TaxID=2082293 RepID=A0A2J6PWL3_9HELO|nr:hypothetical protein NA56DRAFT_751370 [Hyaloscypha hepaticicola]